MTRYLLPFMILGSLAQAAVKPATDLSQAPTKDPFIGYQWGLMNKGQVITQDADDTHSAEIKSNPSVQIGWKNYDSLMKKDVIIAVLDSGVDTAHPELKDRLVPGFNFTAKTPELGKIYDDKVGHGTHMAGILAAISDNNEGIAGLSGKIKVMPLKVYDGRERATETESGTNENITARVIKAVDFAIANKADILHFSMGWPRANNNATVEAAFKRAHDAGLIVVAAAGNDHHDGQIYPCAYAEVICVASSDIDGKLSRFSNYGGHVDIAAPGQEILSLWPQLMTSIQFGPKGYELKSGTSQAAPFVSGAVAILKGIYPQESAQQIRARILLGATTFENKVGYGFLNIARSLELKTPAITAPVFKGLEDTTVHPQDLSFEFPLVIEKGSSGTPAVKIRSLNAEVKLLVPVKVSEDKSGLRLKVQGRVQNLKIDNRLNFEVEVNGRTFTSALVMKMKLQDFKPLTLTLTQSEAVLKSGFYSVADPNNSSITRYWTYVSDEANSQMKLSVWTLQNNRLEEKSVVLPQVTLPQPGFNLVSDDFDMDGKMDYLFVAVGKKANGDAQINFIYLDENLNTKIRLPLKYEDTIPTYRDIKDLALVKYTVPGLGVLKVPAYWAQGLIPEKDLNPDPFAFEVNNRMQRLFYFEPALVDGTWTMVSRTLNASGFEKNLRQRLGIKQTQDIEYLAMKVQSNADNKAGRFDFVFSVGRGVNTQLYRLPVSDLSQNLKEIKVVALPKSQYDIAKNFPSAAISISREAIDSETNFQALFSFISGRSLLLRNDNLGGNRIDLTDRNEALISITKSFVQESNMTTFFETTEFLRAQGTWKQQKINAKVPVYRSTFLPGSLFSQIFVPVIVSADQQPGILIDNSRFFSRSVFVYALNREGALTSSIERSIDLPANCNLRRVPMLNEAKHSRLAFLCQEKDQLELRLVDLP